jgi:PPOX class probable F420-dependent enzyme
MSDDDVLPDPSSPFGRQVRQRLADESLIWFTTVGTDGNPQPNPVWFLWDGGCVLVYNTPRANRLKHIRRRPQVSLNLNSRNGGGVVVLIGTAELAEGEPPADEHRDYLAKYREGMAAVSGSPEAFARSYSVPVRVRPSRIRGW